MNFSESQKERKSNYPLNYPLFKLFNRVEYEKDEKFSDTGVFTILLEDHTLGNIAKMMLLRNPKVRFAGYRKPHPLENKVELKIQTNGEITPAQAFKEALKNLVEDCDMATKRFGVR